MAVPKQWIFGRFLVFRQKRIIIFADSSVQWIFTGINTERAKYSYLMKGYILHISLFTENRKDVRENRKDTTFVYQLQRRSNLGEQFVPLSLNVKKQLELKRKNFRKTVI